MAQQIGFMSLQHALSLSDPFALAVVEQFPHSMDAVDQDMALTFDTYQSLSKGIAFMLQSGLTYQLYSFYVDAFIRWLDDLDMYLRTLPR